jgi:hypothetical protein
MIPDYILNSSSKNTPCTDSHHLENHPDTVFVGARLHSFQAQFPEVDHAVLFTCSNCKYARRIIYNHLRETLYCEIYTWHLGPKPRWVWAVVKDTLHISKAKAVRIPE